MANDEDEAAKIDAHLPLKKSTPIMGDEIKALSKISKLGIPKNLVTNFV